MGTDRQVRPPQVFYCRAGNETKSLDLGKKKEKRREDLQVVLACLGRWITVMSEEGRLGRDSLWDNLGRWWDGSLQLVFYCNTRNETGG